MDERTPGDFEQLVSEALDAPADAASQERLAASCAGDPGRAAVVEQWRRLHATIRRQGGDVGERVDWTKLAAAISATIDRDMTALDGRLDFALKIPDTLDEAVDWPRLRERISASIEPRSAARRRALPTWARFSVALSAAAAGLWFVTSLRTAPSVVPNGAMQIAILVSSPHGSPALDRESVHIAVSAPADAAESSPVVAAASEVFLMIDPVPASLGGVGSGISADVQ